MGQVIGVKYEVNDSGNVAASSVAIKPTYPLVLTGNASDPSEVKAPTAAIHTSGMQEVGIAIENADPSGEVTFCKKGIVQVRIASAVTMVANMPPRLKTNAANPLLYETVTDMAPDGATQTYSFLKALTGGTTAQDMIYAEIDPMYLTTT